MDDLRRRFEALDNVEVPDLWDEVRHRADLMGAERPETTPIRAGRPRLRGEQPVGPFGIGAPAWIAVLVAALLLSALAVYLVGSAIVERDLTARPPSIPAPSVPAPSGSAPNASPVPPVAAAHPLDCETAQRLVRTEARGWFAGPAPDSIANSHPATIVTWATDDGGRPVVSLIDPLTGAACPLDIPFTPDQTIERIAWSPDGNALAISTYEVIPKSGGSRARLAVLSPFGLYRGGVAGDIAWSPDGSRLAVQYTSHSPGPGPASIWIVERNGGQRQLEFDCDPCYPAISAGSELPEDTPSIIWSPTGSRLAFPYEQYAAQPAASPQLAAHRTLVASASGDVIAILDNTRVGAWVDDETVANIATTGEAFAQPIDQPDHRQPVSVVLRKRGQSPDGRYIARIDVRNEATGEGDLIVDDLVGGGSTTVSSGRLSGNQWIWSRDSSMIVFAESPEPSSGVKPGIWIVKVDGTGLRRLTDAVAADGGISIVMPTAWQPVWIAGQ